MVLLEPEVGGATPSRLATSPLRSAVILGGTVTAKAIVVAVKAAGVVEIALTEVVIGEDASCRMRRRSAGVLLLEAYVAN